jgi:Na+/H+-dicarboxylate symporter
VEVIKPLEIYFKFTFTAIIPLIFFTIASSIASLEKSEKLGKLFVVVIGVFYRSYFGSIDDGWRAAPIHQDIIISTIPLESMKSASPGSQITELLTANDFYKLLSRKKC